MIALVEGAQRQKTPNEIALTILLVGLTIVFLAGDLDPRVFRHLCRWAGVGGHPHRAVRHAHPDHHRRALSAIGIAGMDRLVRYNVLAMSGRAVEAAGDVDTLLLDKTGTITLGNRMATEFVPMPGVSEAELAEPRSSPRSAMRPPRGAPSSCWRRRSTGYAGVRWPIAVRNSSRLRRKHAHERRRCQWQSDPQGATDAVLAFVCKKNGGGYNRPRAQRNGGSHRQVGGTPLVGRTAACSG